MWPIPKAANPNEVQIGSLLVSMYLISRKISPKSPKKRPKMTKIPKVEYGFFDVNHATNAVAMNIIDVRPLKITAVTLFSFTLKKRKTASKTAPIISWINQ